MNWIMIDDSNGFRTERTKILGGWLVRIWTPMRGEEDKAGGLAFVPDPKHEWDGKSLR
jgi:hypothetical protein